MKALLAKGRAASSAPAKGGARGRLLLVGRSSARRIAASAQTAPAPAPESERGRINFAVPEHSVGQGKSAAAVTRPIELNETTGQGKALP